MTQAQQIRELHAERANVAEIAGFLGLPAHRVRQALRGVRRHHPDPLNAISNDWVRSS